jgi:hypothetical protein
MPRTNRGTCLCSGCSSITSNGTLFRPTTAPPSGRYALPRENCAGTHRIPCLTLILRTIAAIRIRLLIERSRGLFVRIQCGGVAISSGIDEKSCNRNKCARNEAVLHQRSPRDISNHDPDPLDDLNSGTTCIGATVAGGFGPGVRADGDESRPPVWGAE